MTEQGELMPADGNSLALKPGAELDDLPANAWEKNLVQMIEVQEAAFVRDGLSEGEAFRLARVGMLALAEFHGARQWYLPRGDRLRTALRDAEIYRRARRGNIQALAAEFQLSDLQVWRIVRQQRKLHLRKIQGQLFEGE